MSTVLITGANRGIGLALTEFYRARGFDVIAVCRSASQALIDSGAKVIDGVDLSDRAAIAALAPRVADLLKGEKLSLLINNAGIFENETLPGLDLSAIERQFAINALAPLALTDALLGLLSDSSKIAFITSRMGSISDNGSGAYYGYRMSKAALNAGAVSLARDLAPRGISVAILHPGFVQTQMVNFAGDISAPVAAERLATRISELTPETSGGFWHSNGERLPW